MEFQDYTIHNGIGIRVREATSCRVIRLTQGKWVEIGNEYSIPVEPTALVWTENGIPATVLAVALRVYELDNPASTLRSHLTAEPLQDVRRLDRSKSSKSALRQFATATR